MNFSPDSYITQIHFPTSGSHKGQNGKVLLIGGSELFHAASQWSLLVLSRMVDMVFYASIPSNNEIVQHAKEQFPNGIVISRDDIENYIEESDVILIGPGMTRSEETEEITNSLLKKYPHKKWVIDAGALQMVDPSLLNKKMIITPHHKEFLWLKEKVKDDSLPCTVLLKGLIDQVSFVDQVENISGGNVGMTKGGTGDVLAGLVAGLYAFTDDPFAAAVVGSYINKTAGDELHKTVGPFFNATDLANQIPKTTHETFQT